MSSPQKTSPWLKGGIAIAAVIGITVLIVLLISHFDKKKPASTTPQPSSNGSNGSSVQSAAPMPSHMPPPATPPSTGPACGCVSGVAYGAEYTDIHPLQTLTAANMKGCKNTSAANYDANPNAVPTVDGCQHKVYGCTDERAWNYSRWANTSYAGACWYPAAIHGCTDPKAFNYDAKAEVDDGSCIPRIAGCTSIYAANYNPHANTSDDSCIPFKLGCTDPKARNYDDMATIDDGGCANPGRTGCTALPAANYDRFAKFDDGTCCGKRDGMIQCGNPFSKTVADPATVREAGDCSFCSE